MNRIRNDHQFLVVRVFTVLYHVGVGIPAEITGVCLLPVNDQDSGANFIAVLQDWLI